MVYQNVHKNPEQEGPIFAWFFAGHCPVSGANIQACICWIRRTTNYHQPFTFK